MKAGIDLDGVIADLLTPFIRKINKEFGLSVKRKNISSFYFSDCIPSPNWDDIIKIWEDPDFILKQPLVPWARWGINRLRDLGYAIYIVTARKSHLKEATLQWLKKHKIYFDEIVTGKQEEKWSYIERKGLDIFVEDKAQNALEAIRFCERVYLIDAPYNKQLDEPKAIRVKGWREIVEQERRFINNGA